MKFEKIIFIIYPIWTWLIYIPADKLNVLNVFGAVIVSLKLDKNDQINLFKG